MSKKRVDIYFEFRIWSHGIVLIFGDNRPYFCIVRPLWHLSMPTLLILREGKLSIYAMRCLLETLKISLCTFVQLSVFLLHKTMAHLLRKIYKELENSPGKWAKQMQDF
ncbi:hypothetical protein CW304_21670 [Bacillus sp. UFRGS-B20]|nr:hypothetical protein CW304_21670 [Bacillus sp. UFRGS-B20]